MTRRDADERALLESLLDAQRGEVAAILDGLSEPEARARLVPSLTTPMGLVKHATFVEQVWFHSRVADVPRAQLGLAETVDESFTLAPSDTVESVCRDFLDACEHSRAVAAGRDLDETYVWHETTVSLRYVHLHLIAELARHAGHGDILAEQVTARRTT